MIENLKDLDRLLKLCRKQGVTEIALPSVSFKLGDMPTRHPEQSIEDQDESYEQVDEPLTPQLLAMLSNGGTNEN